MLKDIQMDKMLEDIVEIFHLNEKIEQEHQENLKKLEETNSSDITETPKFQKVNLVRLSGLTRRANRISGRIISHETIDYIVQKMKLQNIIDFRYSFQCPFCGEIIYQIEDIPADKPRLCDSCQSIIIPNQCLHSAIIKI